MVKVPEEIQKLKEEIEEEGVKVLATYQEPYSQSWQMLVLIDIDKVQPTTFQRDLSEYHVERLIDVISSTGRYLDPIILIRPKNGIWLTPNGNHRREAMKRLGKEKIIGILVPEPEFAYKILPLNVEKAHDLKEKSLEVIRIYQELLKKYPKKSEAEFASIFEEPIFITFGLLYESKEKFGGVAYYSFLKKIENFLEDPLKEAIKERKRRAELIWQIDIKVRKILENLRAKGIYNPFLKMMIVSKANPFPRRKKVEVEYEEALKKFEENLEKIDFTQLEKIEEESIKE